VQVFTNPQHPFGFSIKKFIKGFNEKLDYFDSPKRACALIKRYISEASELVCKSWYELKLTKEFEILTKNILEDVVFRGIYEPVFSIFNKQNIQFQESLREKQKILGSITLQSFGSSLSIDPSHQVEILQPALVFLNELLLETSPNKKFAKLNLMTEAISKIIEETWKSKQSGLQVVAADDLLSILCFLVAQSPPELPAHISFLFEFVNPEQLRGQFGYYLTSLHLAIQYVLQYEKHDAMTFEATTSTLRTWNVESDNPISTSSLPKLSSDFLESLLELPNSPDDDDQVLSKHVFAENSIRFSSPLNLEKLIETSLSQSFQDQSLD
jgi:hypothetical protein